MTVEGLIGRTLVGDDVRVIGYVVLGSAGARLCDALAESFPPQCGGATVPILAGEDFGLDFEEAQGIRWTETRIAFRGRWSDGVFTALEAV